MITLIVPLLEPNWAGPVSVLLHRPYGKLRHNRCRLVCHSVTRTSFACYKGTPFSQFSRHLNRWHLKFGMVKSRCGRVGNLSFASGEEKKFIIIL